ncbi:phosphonate metabolism transcriptional regulator PhnF [Rhodocyclaceae bacterium SMB388]
MSLYLLDRESGTAIYAQIARQLEKEVRDQQAPGDCLPSEGALAARFGVNRHTLRRAVDELVEAGLLERRHGLGVFVLDTQWDYQIGKGTRFTENLALLGLTAENRILRAQTIEASPSVAARLAIAAGAKVHWLETLRLADQRPVCVISHFVPATRFPDLRQRFESGSLHAVLKADYGCSLRRTESLVTAVLPQGDDARLLAMPQNRPVLRVKSINVDERDDTPVEYAITRFRADRIQLRITP